MNRLREKYEKVIVPKLQSELKLTNKFAVPRLVKLIVSTSFKEDQHHNEAIATASGWLATMTGQKPRETRARASIAGFNVREGDVVGLQVTLRRERMWDFTDKLISIALPRVKDFQGVPSDSFDGHGNYTLGITEQIIFPEVEYDTVGKVRGLQITFVMDTNNDKISRRLLEELGMPFEKQEAVHRKQ